MERRGANDQAARIAPEQERNPALKNVMLVFRGREAAVGKSQKVHWRGECRDYFRVTQNNRPMSSVGAFERQR